jgi:hypothetical protein
MKIAKPIFWVVLAALAGWAVWNLFFQPPARIIEKRLNKLAEAISEHPQGNISKVANANRIGSFFHPNVSINLEGFGREVASIQGRGELEQMAMGARQRDLVLQVHFSNLHIQAERGATNASALVTVEVKLNDQTDPVVQDVRLSWEKVDRSWVIRSAEPMKGLKLK